MRKITVAATVAAFASSLASFIIWPGNSVTPDTPRPSISIDQMNQAGPPLPVGSAYDAF